MAKLEKSERKLNRKEKWILTFVAILGVVFALVVSKFIQGLFINPSI